MTKENAINFLLYSYFGVTLADSKEEIIDGAIERAYRDASGRVLSITDECGGNESYKRNAKERLKSQIDKLEKRTTPFSYDGEWFYNTCDKLIEEYKSAKGKEGNDAFYFGHAQKWVNMTMKYLCVLKSISHVYGKEDIFGWLTDELEKQLHIPVDSYIMEAARELKIQFPGKDDKLVTYSSAKSWSKWVCGDYEKFRKELEGKIPEDSPLDWEGPAWIRVAKKRKEKEKKN